MSRILIIEDEQRISSFVAKGLKAAGLQPSVADTGEAGLRLATDGEFEAIILDLGLPDLDGYEVLKRLRAFGLQTPVIILTARSSIDDTVTGLQSGADDYMAKPFHFEELLARLRLRLKPENSTSDPALLSNGDLEMDCRGRRALLQGREVDLSAREFALAETFLRNPGQVLSREQLLSRVWGYDFDPGSNIVDVYVRYLRNKLGAERFETVRGMGYRMVDLG
ncbi:MAG: response regulator transcription factor [Arthrobacter sp.]|uniref:response regulator transcription factor n=1 Tax=Arthrobacter TaxID=1663 RepID=UPI002656364C|nr:response regulator transcription factor [Micrococcaceae bacterium]MDN5813009.1 response regulator transcription factor [Micrococcaceae bacterium]MDN5825115.1 response regulator transcription factor [Micrococcaceae bacterium]MDN5878486.1 response regulator transcription factor [Micrococcaceae bacterium]MDN5885458.1 response regulator transcription factor [Micrococcaceae bacterium]